MPIKFLVCRGGGFWAFSEGSFAPFPALLRSFADLRLRSFALICAF